MQPSAFDTGIVCTAPLPPQTSRRRSRRWRCRRQSTRRRQWLRLGIHCSPRHMKPLNSMKRGLKMRADDVAGNACQVLPAEQADIARYVIRSSTSMKRGVTRRAKPMKWRAISARTCQWRIRRRRRLSPAAASQRRSCPLHQQWFWAPSARTWQTSLTTSCVAI